MSDDLVKRLRNTPNWMREEYGHYKDGLKVYDRAPFEAADALDAQAAEIARLRALCDRQSTALSLSGMRHGRILVGLERRNRRQRRALAKLYQRRHDKNAALATARREGEAAGIEWGAGMISAFMKIADKMSDGLGLERDPVKAIEFAIARTLEEAAAIRAAAKDGE